MVRVDISSRDKAVLRFIESDIKINTNYYINKILKPFLLCDTPCVLRNNTKKIIFHQDNVPSHVSKKQKLLF